jgi:hypothetical protein
MAGRFVHLDDYTSTIETTVARPVLLSAPDEQRLRADTAPTVERWPPLRAPLSFWGSASVLANHCAWLAESVPAEYLRSYWALYQRIPAVGHLHILYDNQGLHGWGDVFGEGAVDLVSELCVCDCPMLAAASASEGAVVNLVSRCLRSRTQNPVPGAA